MNINTLFHLKGPLLNELLMAFSYFYRQNYSQPNSAVPLLPFLMLFPNMPSLLSFIEHILSPFLLLSWLGAPYEGIPFWC